MAQHSQSPLTPLNPESAAGIARSSEELRLWSKAANAVIHLGNSALEEQLFKNATLVAEAIREHHPQSSRRSQPEREALDVYHQLFNRLFNNNDLAKASIADIPPENKRVAGNMSYAIGARKRRSKLIEAYAQASNTAPTAASQVQNDQHDQRTSQAKQGIRSRPIKVIEDAVVGPIEKAAKKYRRAQEKLLSLQKRTLPNTDTKNKAETKANNALRQYLLAVQSKIQTARNNSLHKVVHSNDQYRNPIDNAILQDHLTPYDFDRLHTISRHDVPSGINEVEDGRWLLVAKFSDPMRRPQIIGVDFDEESGKFNAARLTLDQGLSALQNATSSREVRIQAAQKALADEWHRNDFDEVHAPIHEAVKAFSPSTADSIHNHDEDPVKIPDTDTGPQC